LSLGGTAGRADGGRGSRQHEPPPASDDEGNESGSENDEDDDAPREDPRVKVPPSPAHPLVRPLSRLLTTQNCCPAPLSHAADAGHSHRGSAGVANGWRVSGLQAHSAFRMFGHSLVNQDMERMVRNMVRYALFCERQRTSIKRADVSKRSTSTRPDGPAVSSDRTADSPLRR